MNQGVKQMPDEELASAHMPFWFLSVMFITNFGCMICGLLFLFGTQPPLMRWLNVFFYFSGGMGAATNVVMLNNYKEIKSD